MADRVRPYAIVLQGDGGPEPGFVFFVFAYTADDARSQFCRGRARNDIDQVRPPLPTEHEQVRLRAKLNGYDDVHATRLRDVVLHSVPDRGDRV